VCRTEVWHTFFLPLIFCLIAIRYINDKRIENIRKRAPDFITSRLAPQLSKNDGKQGPMKERPMFIAKHTAAIYCRGCIHKRYGIREEKALADDSALRNRVNMKSGKGRLTC